MKFFFSSRKLFSKFLIALVLLVFAFSLLSAKTTLAAEENFSTSLKTTYTVQDSGNTLIEHNYEITNLKPLFTVTQYGLKISSPTITNVQVTSDGKNITPEINQTETQTTIGITFPDEVVGEGKKRKFNITYSDPEAAVVSGQVLEIAVPEVKNANYQNYSVDLVTPIKFGSPNRVTPHSYKIDISPEGVVTKFENLVGESIVALYGDKQAFDLELKYTLENPTSNAGLTQISLPPDTTFQKMTYYSLEPFPTEVELDADGNWIATYYLDPNSTVIVTAKAQAFLQLEPDPNIPVPIASDSLTQAQEFWESNKKSIVETAAVLETPRDIYDYVTETLTYNYQRLETDIARLGANDALSAPDQALCQEFTDAFVALSRAKDIHSRRVTGYAYTENSVLRPLSLVEDVLHAWPEYYDQTRQIWVPIDPTWGHTSGGINYFDQFDLNHIVFSINGASSTLPYPAGSYKGAEDPNSKDIEVRFSPNALPTTAEPDYQLEFISQNLLGLPIPATQYLAVTNVSGQAQYKQQIVLQPADASVILEPQTIIELDSILPFQTIKVPIVAISQDMWIPKETAVLINYANKNQSLTVIAIPRLWFRLFQPSSIIGLGVGSTVIAFGAWGLLVLRRR